MLKRVKQVLQEVWYVASNVDYLDLFWKNLFINFNYLFVNENDDLLSTLTS